MFGRKKYALIAIIFILGGFAAYFLPVVCAFPTIGMIHGLENELITIDDVTYTRTHTPEIDGVRLTSADRGIYIGSVKNDAITMRVFRVSGDTDENFLFALWDWEGYFYVKQSKSPAFE